MSIASQEEIKQEAIKRMREIIQHGANPILLSKLEEGEVYYSYLNSGIAGCVDTINYDPSYAELVKNFEMKNPRYYVYHVIETIDFFGCGDVIGLSESYEMRQSPRGKEGGFGTILTLLCVSPVKEEWKYQHITTGPYDLLYIDAFMFNLTKKWAEAGDVFFQTDNGALFRVG
jgi:hypothetical protein